MFSCFEDAKIKIALELVVYFLKMIYFAVFQEDLESMVFSQHPTLSICLIDDHSDLLPI